jgi:hypothetical protein
MAALPGIFDMAACVRDCIHVAHLHVPLHRLLLCHEALQVLSVIVLVVRLRKPELRRWLHRLLHGGQLFESAELVACAAGTLSTRCLDVLSGSVPRCQHRLLHHLLNATGTSAGSDNHSDDRLPEKTCMLPVPPIVLKLISDLRARCCMRTGRQFAVQQCG